LRTPLSKSKWQNRERQFLTTRKPGLRFSGEGWGGSGVLTTSSCESNPDGDGDALGAQKCRCMMQTCSLAHWRQSYVCAQQAEQAAPDVLGRVSAQIPLSHICFIVRAGFSFTRGNTGKYKTTASENRYLRQCNCQRPDWGVYSKRGRQICIASTCLLVDFRRQVCDFAFVPEKTRWLRKASLPLIFLLIGPFCTKPCGVYHNTKLSLGQS